MRKIWLKVNDFNKELITFALEKGINDFLVNETYFKEKIESLGKVKVYTKEDVIIYKYKDKSDEEEIEKLSKDKPLILLSESWEIIPWENLVAKNVDFFVVVKDFNEFKTAIGVLEKGVRGIILDINSIDTLNEILKELKKQKIKIPLSIAKIVNVKILDSGERVCIDTCNLMTIGEGILVGSSSNFLFLVHSESIENPYCDPRPFRVNAGAVYAYTKVDLDKTKYLSELKSGDEILIVNYKGEIRKGIIGRCKIETRPLILIEAELNGKIQSIILQNAETINLVNINGNPISVTKLKKGDKVLVYTEKGARHFGIKIEEKIIEQ